MISIVTSKIKMAQNDDDSHWRCTHLHGQSSSMQCTGPICILIVIAFDGRFTTNQASKQANCTTPMIRERPFMAVASRARVNEHGPGPGASIMLTDINQFRNRVIPLSTLAVLNPFWPILHRSRDSHGKQMVRAKPSADGLTIVTS